MSWESVRKSVFLRDEGICRRCSRPATDCHHRKPKQMGGSSDPERNFGMANLVSLCRTCHNYIHAHPAEAYKDGWLVHSWQSPEEVPVPGGVKYDF